MGCAQGPVELFCYTPRTTHLVNPAVAFVAAADDVDDSDSYDG